MDVPRRAVVVVSGTLVICRGIPASGKTTWARAWVAERPQRAKVCRDDLRHAMFGVFWGLMSAQENAVTVAQHAAVEQLLRKDWDVVVDDTNLRAQSYKALAAIAAKVGSPVETKDFPISIETAIARDQARADAGQRHVGEEVIREKFWAKFIRNGELPPVPEVEQTTVELYVPDHSLPKAWLVDMDGTLAKMNGRGPFEWHRVGEDQPNEAVVDVVRALADRDNAIVVVSGRDGCCLDQTESWLDDWSVPWDELLMREAGDTRKDSIVKSEIFWRDIAPHWDVVGVLDDRNQVVDMWRSLGIPCLQVAPGDF